MKRKLKFLLSLSTLSVYLMACGTNEPVENSAENAPEEVTEEAQVENVEANLAEEQDLVKEENEQQEEKVRFIRQSIDDLYNYDNKSYDDRNQKLLENFIQERANEISNFETLDSATDFVSTVEIDNVYSDIADNNRFVVEGEMSFQVEDNEATIYRNVIILAIEERADEYRITEMETVPVPRPTMVP